MFCFYFRVSAGVLVDQHLPQKNNIQNIATGTKDPRPECFFPITAELSATPMPLYSIASFWCCPLSHFFNRLHLIAHSWAGQKWRAREKIKRPNIRSCVPISSRYQSWSNKFKSKNYESISQSVNDIDKVRQGSSSGQIRIEKHFVHV